MNASPGGTDHDEQIAASVVRVTVAICTLCLRGEEGECHVPGCVFWMCPAPTAEQAERLKEGAVARAG